MIKLLRLVTGQSICGDDLGERSDSGDMVLKRPLVFYSINENYSVYDPTYLALLKYDFISDTESVVFNKSHIISITNVIDEAVEWYKIVAEFVYDITKDQRKESLKAMTEASIDYQKKVVEAIKTSKAAANTETSNTETTDASWVDKVDTKIRN